MTALTSSRTRADLRPSIWRRATDVFWAAIACPLIAMALLVNAYLFSWPDEDTVRAINDSLVRDAPSDTGQQDSVQDKEPR